MEDVLGQALKDYFEKPVRRKLWIYNRYGNKEEMPVSTYFRTADAMTDLEWLALEHCSGQVLDIGAAAGSHCLELQDRRLTATAIDISPGAVEVMRRRGVKKVVQGNIFYYEEHTFDTLLLLMNGIGLAGSITGLGRLLLHLRNLLKPGGQIIFDSSDVAYLYDGKPMPAEAYYGEIYYRYSYKKQTSDWFSWLYADKSTMLKAAKAAGFKMDVLLEDDFDQYLARLTG